MNSRTNLLYNETSLLIKKKPFRFQHIVLADPFLWDTSISGFSNYEHIIFIPFREKLH